MILRPFAWIYQIGKYINKGLHHGESALGMGAQLRTARKRNALFDALGVRQESKGLVIYKDGEYIKR